MLGGIYLIYKEPRDTQDSTQLSPLRSAVIELNKRLIAAGCKCTHFDDDRFKGRKESDRDDEKFRGTLAEKNYKRWLDSNVYKGKA